MARPKAQPHQLTKREAEIDHLMRQGYDNAQIAAHLEISPKTLETHIGNIYAKQTEPLAAQGPARRMEFLVRLLRSG
jgi:DNA-binding NarL/FixJ family response regulator